MKIIISYFSLFFMLVLFVGCVPNKSSIPFSPSFVEVKESIEVSIDAPDRTDSVHCSITGGQAKFAKGWFPIGDTAFDIYRGDVLFIPLQKKAQKETSSIQAYFDKDGQKMVFCPKISEQQAGKKVSCTSLYALDDDYTLGIKRTFDVPKMVRGSTMLCKHQTINS